MARLTNKTIPTAFQKLDATMSDADEFINVRDLQVARQNHNMLIARGLRRTLFSRSFADKEWIVREGNLGDERLGAQRPIIEASVAIDSPVASISCVIEGSVIGTGLDIEFKCVVDRPFGLRDDSAAGTATLSQGGATKASITVPVPYLSEEERGGMPLFRVALFMGPEIGANLASSIGINSVSSTGHSVNVNDASLPAGTQEGRVLHFDSDTSIPARICARRVDNGADSDLFVVKPFGPIPTASDTLSIDEVATFDPNCVTLYEDHLTSFDAARAGI